MLGTWAQSCATAPPLGRASQRFRHTQGRAWVACFALRQTSTVAHQVRVSAIPSWLGSTVGHDQPAPSKQELT